MRAIQKPYFLFVMLLAALLVSAGAGQKALAQGIMAGNFDPEIPTLEAVAGHALGQKITSSEDILSYLQALERAAPDRVTLVTYAQSWQGRPLVYAIISAPETMARLDAVKGDLGRLASGQAIGAGEQSELIGRTPAVAWLGFGVHGDEITPSDSGLALAYHLLASRGDPLVERILANTIVIIDPNQNPDGRARFLHGFREALGIIPQADRFAAEHDQPWPGGRFNHYLFDMNRDWFAVTQPETKGRIAAYLDWHPVVFVDSHEMGGDQTYFFPPAAEPFNPLITDAQKASQDRFGRNRGAWFDRLGIAYFTREIFDAFYPGYGDMWPTLNGAIAKTFEQGSPRGLIFQRRNGDLLTYEEGVFNNFIASLATLETVADEKDRLLAEYAAYRRSAVTEGERAAERFYVIDLSERRGQAERLGRTLMAQGIEVSRISGAATFCGRTYPAGALVVDKAQGAGRLARALLEPQIALPADFMERQEARRKAGLPHELYDVTAWSMPVMEGVDVTACRNVGEAGLSRIAPDTPPPAIITGQGGVAYAVPWTDSVQARIVVAALQAGLTGSATDEAFTQGGREFGKGTVVFPRAGNPDDFGARLRQIAADYGGEIVSLPTSWVDHGPNFGSSAFVRLTAPRIAMAWDDGTSPTEAGAARWTLEHKLGLPVTPIRVRTLGAARLSDYDVLVLPEVSGRFSAALGSAGASALKEFTARGGVLISFGSATGALVSDELGLLSTVTEYAWTEAEETDEAARRKGTRLGSQEEYQDLIAEVEAAPESVPGALVRLEADPDHWLAAGYDHATALVRGSAIFRPLGRTDGANVFRFADAQELIVSGYLWEENQLQLAYKPYLMVENHGQGMVIAFAQSPVTRGYLGGLDLLVANAVLVSPARVTAAGGR